MRQHRKLLISTVAILLLCGSASHAWGDSVVASEGFEGAGLPPAWTLIGTGGVSGAVTGLAPTEGSQFAWIDTGPNFSESANFPSILESPSFSVTSRETVSADVNFMSTDETPFNDSAEVFLTSGSTVVATLFSAEAGCGNTNVTQFGIIPDLFPPSPGVKLSPSTADFQGNVVGPLNGNTYGPGRVFTGSCFPATFANLPGGSMGWVTTSYTPAPGTYQLAFQVANGGDNIDPSALAIDNVRITTPEPRTLALLLIGLAGVLALQGWTSRLRLRFAKI